MAGKPHVSEEEVPDTPRIKELKYKARRNNIKAGIFTSAKLSFGDSFLSPFALAINASNSFVVFLSSLAGILGPMSQLLGSRMIERFPRKKIVLNSIFIELFAWAPLIAIAILYYENVIRSQLPLIFLLVFAFYVIFENVGSPAWFSWTGDIVSENYRGRWFAKRNLFMGFVSVVLAVSASFFLDYSKKSHLVMFGFSVLFLLAFISRVFSWRFYRKQYEPKIKLKKGDFFSFTDFIMKGRKTNFGRFTFFNAILNLTIYISSPLFVVYMLRDLKFSYMLYIVITMAGTVFSLIVMELWGKISDKYGNYAVLYITSVMIPIIPLLWIISPSPLYLIFVPTLVSGIAFAGFNLSSSNFIYDNVHISKRGLAVSYFNMLNGIGVFIGAGIGALLINYLVLKAINPVFIIFLLSGIAGIVTIFIFMPMFNEVRKVKHGKIAGVLFREFRPSVVGGFREILSIKKYLRR